MPERVTDEDLELLDELGVDTAPTIAGGRTAREQRIIAGFEEIERFVAENGRVPQHGEQRDIFERLYAVRLDQIRKSSECRELLRNVDTHGLLGVEEGDQASEAGEPDDDELLAALGVEAPPGNDVTELVHVRSREDIRAAEEIARRAPCLDFDQFKPIFERVQHELEAGERRTIKYKEYAEFKIGDLFVLDGQKAMVADFLDEQFMTDYGRHNRRLRVVFDNGTESNLLQRSLQRGLYKDKNSRRITERDFQPLFADIEEADDLASGFIYVLRSLSEQPFIAEHREVIHKIGVTGGDVEARIANAKKDPTYLLADVEVVATFKLANVSRKRLEALLQRFFGGARLELALPDRFGAHVEPREWFLVPLPAIKEAIERIIDGSISDYRYDPGTASLVPL